MAVPDEGLGELPMTRREIVQTILAAVLLAVLQIWGIWIGMAGGEEIRAHGQLLSEHEPSRQRQ